MKQLPLLAVLLLGLVLGALAGHYHGKAETLSNLVGTDITCKLGVNPITASRLD